MLMIRVKLTLQMLQMLLHINPSHKDEPFQSKVSSLKLNAVSKTLDFDQVPSTGIVAARKKHKDSTLKEQMSVKKEQIKKANDFIRLSKLPKHAATVQAGLKEMGVNMLENDSDEEYLNSFFHIFVDTEFETYKVDEKHIILHRKLVDYISDNKNEFSEVCFIITLSFPFTSLVQSKF